MLGQPGLSSVNKVYISIYLSILYHIKYLSYSSASKSYLVLSSSSSLKQNKSNKLLIKTEPEKVNISRRRLTHFPKYININSQTQSIVLIIIFTSIFTSNTVIDESPYQNVQHTLTKSRYARCYKI